MEIPLNHILHKDQRKLIPHRINVFVYLEKLITKNKSLKQRPLEYQKLGISDKIKIKNKNIIDI